MDFKNNLRTMNSLLVRLILLELKNNINCNTLIEHVVIPRI